MDRGASVTPSAVDSGAEGPSLAVTIEYEVSREDFMLMARRDVHYDISGAEMSMTERRVQ
jgi:hypothetical protein